MIGTNMDIKGNSGEGSKENKEQRRESFNHLKAHTYHE